LLGEDNRTTLMIKNISNKYFFWSSCTFIFFLLALLSFHLHLTNSLFGFCPYHFWCITLLLTPMLSRSFAW
jgi:hypothetical protein